ncbi:hypothetical protein ACIBEA_39705 [Streptomyces sp. NPDC051555]|uniref:hypothetical protein n=1 Tax=Streptomyces sp. NPDC051555 TaxID=3365657 RepID=UPI00379C3436
MKTTVLSAAASGGQVIAAHSPSRVRRAPQPFPHSEAGYGPTRAERDLLDRVLTGLRSIEIPGEEPRRAQRVEELRDRLAQSIGWLCALPQTQATGVLIELASRWMGAEPRNRAHPSDRFIGVLGGVSDQIVGYLNAHAAAAVYAAVPASADHAEVLGSLECSAGRFCGRVTHWLHDVELLPLQDRPGLWAVRQLVESRDIQVLIVPGLDHLMSAGPHEAAGPWSVAGFCEFLNVYGVRLIAADHDGVLTPSAWEETR